MIPKEKVEEIRSRADIVSVISEYVPLKKRGKNYLGLCPFHSEKDASFTVSPDKQLFHCFGCGEGGNAIAFLMKIENISFVEAVAELGNKVGLPIDPGQTLAAKGDKEKLYDVMRMASHYYQEQLTAVAGDYLVQRQINQDTAKLFGLGGAADNWDGLFRQLITRGVAPAVMERAGLVLPRESKDSFYDRFRFRLLFPVQDIRGRTIAFSGRSLDGKEPKYLNSPDTPIYRKSDSLFGLAITKDFIKQAKTAVLVEGNVDVLTLFQAGVKNVVAPLGTALTAEQCKLLARFCDKIIVAFDSDAAGLLATERSAELLRSQGLLVKVIEFSGAKDPDELIKQAGITAFNQALDRALPFIEFKIKRAIGRFNLAEIEEKSKAMRQVATILGQEQDSFAQKEYAKLAAAALQVDTETLLAEIKRDVFYQKQGKGDPRRQTEKPVTRLAEAEKHLLATAIEDQAARQTLLATLTEKDFSGSEAKAIMGQLIARPAADQHQLLDSLEGEAARSYFTRLLIDEKPAESAEVFADCLAVIKAEASRARVATIKSAINVAERAGETAQVANLLGQLKSEISADSVR